MRERVSSSRSDASTAKRDRIPCLSQNEGFFKIETCINIIWNFNQIFFTTLKLQIDFIFTRMRANLIYLFIFLGARRALRSCSQIRFHASRGHQRRGLGASCDLGYRAGVDLLCTPGAARAANVRISLESPRIPRIFNETLARSYRYAFHHLSALANKFLKSNYASFLFQTIRRGREAPSNPISPFRTSKFHK